MAVPQSSSLLINQVLVSTRAQAFLAQESEVIEPAALLRTGVARWHQSPSPSKLAVLFLNNNSRYFSGPLGIPETLWTSGLWTL